MFSPVYKITNKDLTGLIEIEVSSKILELASLQSDWEIRLRLEALSRKVFYLSKYGGTDLTLEEVSKIVKDEPGRDDKASLVAVRVGVVGKEREIQLVLNLINTNHLVEQIAYLSGKFKQMEMGEKELLQIHSLIGERLIQREKLGSFRLEDNIGDRYFDVPRVEEISFQLEDLFGWFKIATKNEIHPILKAGVMFYELLRIRPFSEYNELVAISYFHLILASEGYGFKKMLSSEEEIFKNEETFGVLLKSVEQNNGDLTVWLEFLCRCVSESSEKIKIKVMNLIGDAPIFKSEKGRVISLSEREIAIMEEITLKNEMTIKEIRTVLPMVSDDTILRDLKDLMEKKLVRKKGRTKGAIYVMGKLRNYK